MQCGCCRRESHHCYEVKVRLHGGPETDEVSRRTRIICIRCMRQLQVMMDRGKRWLNEGMQARSRHKQDEKRWKKESEKWNQRLRDCGYEPEPEGYKIDTEFTEVEPEPEQHQIINVEFKELEPPAPPQRSLEGP
jgi:hypothetical protein